jgi:hypothetical protein
MSFPNFFIVRDLLYLAGIFLGTGAGLILYSTKKNIFFKSRYINAALCMFSVCVVLFSPVIILSRTKFIFNTDLLIVFFCIAAICAITAYFTVFALFPLMLVSSIVIIFLFFYVFRFPFCYETGNSYVDIAKLDLKQSIQVDLSFKDKEYKKFYSTDVKNTSFNYTVFIAKVNNLFPIAGGRVYVIPLTIKLILEDGFTVRIMQETRTQYLIINNIFNDSNKLFRAKRFTGDIELGTIAKDFNLCRLYFDGKDVLVKEY